MHLALLMGYKILQVYFYSEASLKCVFEQCFNCVLFFFSYYYYFLIVFFYFLKVQCNSPVRSYLLASLLPSVTWIKSGREAILFTCQNKKVCDIQKTGRKAQFWKGMNIKIKQYLIINVSNVCLVINIPNIICIVKSTFCNITSCWPLRYVDER